MIRYSLLLMATVLGFAMGFVIGQRSEDHHLKSYGSFSQYSRVNGADDWTCSDDMIVWWPARTDGECYEADKPKGTR